MIHKKGWYWHMIFIIGLVTGWMAGSMVIVVCAIVVTSGRNEYERKLDDEAQEEFLREYNKKKWGDPFGKEDTEAVFSFEEGTGKAGT